MRGQQQAITQEANASNPQVNNHPWDPPFDPRKMPEGPRPKPAMKIILRVNNIEIDNLIDTGSSVTVVPAQIAKRFEWPILPTPPKLRLPILITATGERTQVQPFYTKLKVQVGFATWWHYAWVDDRRLDKYITIGTDFLDGKNIVINCQSRIMIPWTHDYYVSPFDVPNWDGKRHGEIIAERYQEQDGVGSVPPTLDQNVGVMNSEGYWDWMDNIYHSFKEGKLPKSMNHEFLSPENLPSLYRDRQCVGQDDPKNSEFVPYEGYEAEPFVSAKANGLVCKKIITLL